MSLSTFILSLTLAVDIFAAGLAYGLAGLPRARWFTMALVFSFFSTLLPVVGILAARWLSDALGTAIAYLAGGFLIVTGLRALGSVFVAGDGQQESKLSLEPGALAVTAFVVAVDNLAVGLALGILPIRLGALLGYLAVQSFVAALLGLALGQRLGTRLGTGAAALAGAVFVVYGMVLVLQTASAEATP
ncbi:MAG: manganese efflux pump [Chloroflexi bacterium]|nr:manganese efflux pump [Chloroflexota bacterium]